MARVLTTLARRPSPRDGASLMELYGEQHLAQCRPGSAGRKRNLLDVAGLLRFAVASCGASKRWLPLEGEPFHRLVGLAEDAQAQTVPITPSQLQDLLDALAAANKHELRMAVALVGLYGLRPAELMVLSVEEGHLRVGNVKRNRRTARNPKPSRLALPLDLPGMPGEGERVLAQFASGLVQLPQSIRHARDFKACGEAFRQYLDRFPAWQSLVANTPGLTPYGLRHGYAWRGHKGYERSIPVRDLAALMGHNPATHHRHYGKWTAEADLIEVVGRVTRPTQTAAA
jgi:integrase